MSAQVAEQSCPIVNELGLHARAATKLVQTAGRFQSDVRLEKDGMAVNAKSVMGVLLLVACRGTSVNVRAEGPDAREAVSAIAELIANRFGEDR